MTFTSLRTRLTIVFVALAVLPLAVSGGLLGHRSYQQALSSSLSEQRQEARLAATEAGALIEGTVRQLEMAVQTEGLARRDPEAQRRVLARLLVFQDQFAELAYLDADGRERARISLTKVVTAADLGSRAGQPEFVNPRGSGEVWLGPVTIDSETAEPLMAISVPVMNSRQGVVEGVLAAQVRLKRIWEDVARLAAATGDEIIITDQDGLVLAHRNPSVVLRGVHMELPAADGIHRGLDGTPVLTAAAAIPARGRRLVALAEMPLAEAMALPIDTAITTAVAIAVALLAATALVLLARRNIIRPIQRLAATALAVSAGDLSSRADPGGRDEIGELARSFNAMTAQLQASVAVLEVAVAERTRDLSTAQARLVEALESISEGFVLYDTEDRVIVCNRKFREFFPEVADLARPGTPFRDLIDRAASRGVTLDAADNAGEWLRHRLDLRRRQLPHVQRLTSGRWLLVSEHGTAGGQLVCVYTDVTDLKTTEEALRAAKGQAENSARIKSDFLAAMSHELRTPLNAIIGFSDVIVSKVFGEMGNERYAEYVRDIHRSGLHLLALINDVLDLSKIEAGAMSLDHRPVEPGQLIDAALSMVRETAAAAGLALWSEVESGLPAILGDERRLLQVLLNLLSNAMKFTAAGGKVAIGAHRSGDRIDIAVTDSGIGIAPADLATALEAFGQVTSSRSSNQPGTGLGLPLSRQLVELHGGTLQVASKPGIGTTVTICLPVAAPDGTAGEPAVEPHGAVAR
jgi:signal transduction histidine kinase/HAMP domain-containing protein